MLRIFCDGTFQSVGHILHACKTQQIWIVYSRMCSSSIVQLLCYQHDIMGSIGHFGEHAYVRHVSYGNPHRGNQLDTSDGIKYLFEAVATMHPDTQRSFLSHFHTCGNCDACERATTVAEEFGIYDLCDMCDSDACDQKTSI